MYNVQILIYQGMERNIENMQLSGNLFGIFIALKRRRMTKMNGEIKMKRFLNLFSVCVLLLGLSGVANATSINYTYAVDGNSYTSPYSGVTVETFDDQSLLWSWSGNGDVVSGSTGQNAAPFGVSTADTTKYVTVPVNGSTGSYAATLGSNYNYFGIWWGSVDTYNTLSFYDGVTLVASFTGSQAIFPSTANGNQTAPSTNLYINFLDLPAFNSFTMTSTSYAFEADNIAVGTVPEPATMLLLGLGLVGLAGARKTFQK